MNKPNLFTKSFVVDGAAILILAVILRLVFSINSGANPEERRLADDSKGYLELAQNLNKGLGFGRYFDTNAVQANSTQTNLDQTNSVPASASSLTWVPEYCRTPGYPWILSVCARDPDRIPAAAVPLQQAIELLIWFTVFSVCYLYFGRVPGILAGILAALDLQGIALSNMLFSEITFTVVLVASVFTAARMLKERGAAWAAVTGLLLAASIFIRPTTLFLPGFIAFFLVVWAIYRRRWIHLATAIVFLAMAYGPIVAWMARNKSQCGRFALTSMTQSGSLLQAVEILAKEKGISDSDALNELCDRAGVSYWRLRMVPISAEESKRIADASTPIIRAHPGALIKQYAIRTVNLVVGPEKYILQVLGIPPVTFGVLGKAKGAKASGTGLGLAVLAVEVLLILVVYAGVLKTLIQALKGQVFPAWVWVGFWFAVYTLGLSAAVCVGDPRYRWPVYPLLIMVAAASFARPRAMPVAEAGRDAEKTPATTAR